MFNKTLKKSILKLIMEDINNKPITFEIIKQEVKRLLSSEWNRIDKKETDLKDLEINLIIQRKKYFEPNKGEVKNALEIKEKLIEIEKEMHFNQRKTTSKHDEYANKARNIEYTINFINKWLLKD